MRASGEVSSQAWVGHLPRSERFGPSGVLGLESCLAGGEERASVFADVEMGAIRKTELLLALWNELGATLSVRLGRARNLCDALANLGAKDDDRGFADKSNGKVDCGGNLDDVVTVLHPDDVEADGLKALGGVLALSCDRHGIQRHVVAVIDEDKVVQLEVTGKSKRLHSHALLVMGNGCEGRRGAGHRARRGGPIACMHPSPAKQKILLLNILCSAVLYLPAAIFWLTA